VSKINGPRAGHWLDLAFELHPEYIPRLAIVKDEVWPFDDWDTCPPEKVLTWLFRFALLEAGTLARRLDDFNRYCHLEGLTTEAQREQVFRDWCARKGYRL
jgi:hypothetical protein